MSDSVWRWPALDLQGRSAPEQLEVDRAVWGKVHGAASDYRWIAHSQSMEPQARRLELQLRLGDENAPARAACWRALGSSYCAISCYPSRAIDATRRSDFLEKQILEWTPSQGAPAALGALLLLPEVTELGDEIWWHRSDDPGWKGSDFVLPLRPEDAKPASVKEGDLGSIIEKGRASLLESVEEPILAGFYSSVLSGNLPAILSGLSQPLPPEAVAALLLPLPRDLADGLSIAGWVFSQSVVPEIYQKLWHLLLCNRPPAGFHAVGEITGPGREAARALLEGDPERLAPSSRVPVPSSVPERPPFIDSLLEFAKNERRRWLNLEELADGSPLRLAEEHANILEDHFGPVCRAACKVQDRWKREQLRVKADLLRAAALALAPSISEQLGPLDSDRVPALLFYSYLGKRDREKVVEYLGLARFEKVKQQSLSCRLDLFGKELREWLKLV